MLDTDLVWARDPHDGYIQGKISELGAHEYEIVPVDRSIKKRSCPIEDVFPSCEGQSDVSDNCECLEILLSASNATFAHELLLLEVKLVSQKFRLEVTRHEALQKCNGIDFRLSVKPQEPFEGKLRSEIPSSPLNSAQFFFATLACSLRHKFFGKQPCVRINLPVKVL